VRGKNLVLMCLMTVLLTSPVLVNFSFAPTDPHMFISPSTTITNPTEYFTVEVYLMDAIGVAAFEFKYTWDLGLTEFPPTTVEGGFFQDAGYSTYFQVNNNILYKYVLVGCFMAEPGYVDGEGSLAAMTFQVKATESGSSTIHLFDTKLWDEYGNPIAHTTADGTFGTTYPKPVFSWTPANPIAGELVTFDGTASYDPDGGNVVAWQWDFGDGSPLAYGAVVTHTYADYRYEPYEVTLTVTDDNPGNSWYLTKPLRIWRDVGIVSVWTSMDEWDNTHFDAFACDIDPYEGVPGLCWILVTTVNFGTITETYDVVLYADADTSVIGDEIEVFGFASTHTLAPDTGSGFALIFILDVSYGASTWGLNDPVDPGQYTFTAMISYEGDQDSSNDMMQSSFGLHAPTEITRIVRASAGQKAHVYKMKHGPITFGGFIKNFDNIFAVMRPPYDQGEWGRLAIDIFDSFGDPVAHITSAAVYLDYMEECPDQLTAVWSDMAVGDYTAIAYAEFGINGASFPYWGDITIEFSFSVIP